MKFLIRSGPMIALFAVLLCLCAPQAGAWGRDVYKVEGLEAERMAADAVTAKRQALDHLYKEALSRLFRRLARSGDVVRLPLPTRARAEALVASFNVTSEETGATRYAVKAVVNFDRDRVAELFYRSGVQIHDKPGPQVLIIPVHVTAGGVELYDDTPEWSAALAEAIRAERLVKLELAKGSMQDRLEPAERLLALDRVSLDYLRVRHSAQGALIAEYTDATQDAPARFRLAGDSGAGRFEKSVLIAPDVENPFAYAAGLIPEWLDDNWKQIQSHGAYAGVLINGMPLDPPAAPREQTIAIPASAGQAMPELRLAVVQPAMEITPAGKPDPAPAPAVTPVAAPVSAPVPDNAVSTITLEVEGGADQLSISRALARAGPVTAFELRGDGTAQHVVLWYRKDREGLFRALSQNGISIEQNLASNNWRIIFR